LQMQTPCEQQIEQEVAQDQFVNVPSGATDPECRPQDA